MSNVTCKLAFYQDTTEIYSLITLVAQELSFTLNNPHTEGYIFAFSPNGDELRIANGNLLSVDTLICQGAVSLLTYWQGVDESYEVNWYAENEQIIIDFSVAGFAAGGHFLLSDIVTCLLTKYLPQHRNLYVEKNAITIVFE